MVSPLALYLAAFLGPFVQEDAAIIAAATAFLHPQTNDMASGTLILTAMFVGLVMSDLWKYWIGWAARTQKWAQSLARKRLIDQVGQQILTHPGKTLMIARFVPGTRIPAYIASGFFGVPFGRFAFWIVVSGLTYIGTALVVLASVGAVAGRTGQIVVAATLILALLVYAGRGIWRNRRAMA